MERQRFRIRYRGHVQGVGFRYTVKALVTGFEVTGTIRNMPDGGVELVAEGSRSELKAFQEAIRESGLGPLISNEEVNWSAATNEFHGFSILG